MTNKTECKHRNWNTHSNICYKTGQNKGILAENRKILDREIRMECLICGKDLHDKIIMNKIHLHVCSKCREYLIDSLRFKGGKK